MQLTQLLHDIICTEQKSYATNHMYFTYAKPWAACATHGLWLWRSPLACHTRSHTCFAFFIVLLRAKERLLAVYWEHQDQQCLVALVQSRSLYKNDLLYGTFQSWRPGFQPDSPHKPVSLVWFYFQDAIKGRQVFYHEYNVSSFKETPLSLQWLPSHL